MPTINQVICGGGLSILLLATGACSGDEPADSGEPQLTKAAAEVQVLDSERGSAAEPAPLEPGTYAIPVFGAPDDAPSVEVDVPAGWAQDRIHLATGPDLDPHLRRIETGLIDRVASDPCEGLLAPVDQNVPDIVTALSEQKVVDPSTPRPVTVDGHAGQELQFEVPAALDLDTCASSSGGITPFGVGDSWATVFPGWTYRVRVLDVQGDAVAIMAAHGPETTQTELAELDTMIDGASFVGAR